MIPSPCINICRLDANSGLCSGCYRTLEEITAWVRCDDEQRQAILGAVAIRRQTAANTPRELLP